MNCDDHVVGCYCSAYTESQGNAADRTTFIKNYVGHTFQAAPCIDGNTGEPIVDGECEVTQRDFRACTTSGCHGSVDAARTAYQVVQKRLDVLTDILWADTDNDSVMETTDGGLLPQILAQAIGNGNLNEINLYDDDPEVTPAEGAIWNAQLASTSTRAYWRRFAVQGQNSCTPQATCASQGGSNTGHLSSAEGVHNPFLLEALLLESIDYPRT